VIDFLNIHNTIKNIKTFEIKTIEGIDFHINKWIEDGYLFKKIQFTFKEESFEFIEKLKCLDLKTFEAYFQKANLKIKEIFGDYHLNAFDLENSKRLILTFAH
jgi:hypothetical protein